ncbi:MAG: GlsB/YeaQ/YmgE family stress response membrane protein [Gemmatimonadetes bacterium]|nr:GlsB/YeaQ/YmgE family stress response membrane protein [Gemmatimonadota bacterium]
MGILSWILFGLIAGAIAKFIVPGKDPGGCLVTILIGIAGAMIGGFLGTHVFHFGRVERFDLRSLGIAILGAVLLLLVFRLLFRPRSPE